MIVKKKFTQFFGVYDNRMITIHCSDTPANKNYHASDIHQWHLGKGWSGTGYHFVIGREGFVEIGRPLYWNGAHAFGFNIKNIGICLIGNNYPNHLQEHSLVSLIIELCSGNKIKTIVGHNQLTEKKTCPNFDVHYFLMKWSLDSEYSWPGRMTKLQYKELIKS